MIGNAYFNVLLNVHYFLTCYCYIKCDMLNIVSTNIDQLNLSLIERDLCFSNIRKKERQMIT